MARLDPRRFTTLSFDCYGTLIDWEAGILAALTPLLTDRDLPAEPAAVLGLYARLETEIEAEPFRPYREVLREVVRRFADAHGFEPRAAEIDSLPDSLGDWPPFPDTVAALRRLAGRYRLAILSNVDDDLFAASADRLEVRFDPVVTAGQLGSYKPAAANFHALLDRLDLVSKSKLLHVAQSLFHDHVPARRLGLTTAWVDRPSRAPGSGATPPAEAQPDLTVRSLAELADRLEV